MREVHRGAVVSVFAATRPGGGGGEAREAFAVRACRPAVDVVGRVGAERAAERFLARAELQRSWHATAELSGYIAAVHETGRCDGTAVGEVEAGEAAGAGAYAVMDLAGLGSIGRVAGMGAEFDRSTLQAVAGRLAGALAAIKKTTGRGHGALTASNVLLMKGAGAGSGGSGSSGGKAGVAAGGAAVEGGSSGAAKGTGATGEAESGSLASATVVLCDPALEFKGPEDESKDVRGFAEIVHLMAVGRPHHGGWASSAAKRWAALGPSGAAWRKFVESVLDPGAQVEGGRVAGVGIDDLPKLVERLGRASRRRRGVMIGAAAALLLALSAGGYAYKVHLDRAAGNIVQRWNIDPEAPQRWTELCEQYRAWFAYFLRRLEERPSDGVIQAATASLGDGPGARPTRIGSRRDLYRLDSELQALIGALDNERVRAAGLDPDARSDPWSIAGVSQDRDLGLLSQQPPERAKHDSSIERTERLLEIMSAVRDGLANWKGPDVLREAAGEFNGLGWTRAGSYLDELCARFGQGGQGASLSDDVAGDLDAVVAVKPTVDQIRARWRAIKELKETIGECDDPVVARFAEAAAGMVRGAGGTGVGRPADLRSLNEQVAQVEALARDLATFARERWPATDTDSLRESAEYAQMASRTATDGELLRSFMALCGQHPSLDPMLDPRRTWVSPARLAAIDAVVEEISREPLAVGAETYDRTRLEALRRDAETIGARTVVWNRRNQARIEGETGRLDGSLTGFLSEVEQHRETRRAAIATAAEGVRGRLREEGSITASGAIDGAWQRGRDALISSTPDERFPALEAAASVLRDGLRRVDGAVPGAFESAALPAGAAWAGALVEESKKRREVVLAGVVSEFSVDGAAGVEEGAIGVLTERAERAGGAYREWLEGARGLAERASALERALRAGYGTAEAMPGDSSVTLARTAESLRAGAETLGAAGPGVVTLAERVDRLREIEGTDDARALLETIRASGAGAANGAAGGPELTLGAWRRLGSMTGRWPGRVEDVDTLIAARATALSAVEAVEDAERGARLRSQLIDRQTAEMVSGLCEGLGTAADLERVLGRLGEMSVREEDLSPRVRFNAVVLSSRRELGGRRLSDAQAAEEAKGILSRLEAAGLSADERASRALAQVREVADWEPPKVELIDPKTLGPAKLAGWSATEDPETGRLTFRRSGAGPALAIEFDRVEADDTLGTEAFYMTRHEVSLGVTTALLAGEPVRGSVPERFPAPQPEGRVWSGPRVWRLEETPTGKRLSPGRGWLFIDSNIDEKHPAYVPEFLAAGSYWNISDARGGEPSVDHPIQRISFAGAVYLSRLANCRLPSGEEWVAAHRAFVAGRSSAGPWNVRDRTFDAQTAHVQRMRDMPDVKTRTSFQWPNVGGVFAEPQRLPEGKPVPGAVSDDGVLYFARVDAPFGDPPHLIGNVAEFVFDDPVAIEELPIGDLTAAIRLYNRFGEKIRIAGGSAISPVQVALDVPQKLNDEQIIYAEEGFADVGLRLAFSAKGTAARQEPLIAKLMRRLGDESLLLARE